MNSFGQYKRWVVILILLMMGVQAFSSEAVYAANPVIRDQEQVNCFGNVWVNHDNPRYQTFTPAITGHLSKVDIQIFDYYGATGAFQLSIFKEGDLSTPLAQAQLPPTNVGWVSFDFTGVEPYLKKNTMYRMVAASELGGSAGYGWYLSQSDVYGGGYSPAIGRDFCFATYMMPDYSISPAESEVTTAHSSVVANGTSQTTVTVKLKDAQGHALTSGGATVSIESTLGTVGPVTDKQDGTYTATLTSPNTLGTATISARVGGVEIAQKRTVQFVAGAPSATTSTLAVSSSTLPADGSSQSSVTVKLKDAQGHALTSGGATVSIQSTLGTVGPVTDKQDGTYTATLTSTSTLGTATISARVGGVEIAQKGSVQFVAGAPSATTSTLEVSDSTLLADGSSQTSVTVKLKDAQGHALTSGGAIVSIESTLGTVGPVTDKQDGTYTATLTSPNTLGTATISARVGGVEIAQKGSVQFVAGAPSATTSTLEVSDSKLPADGSSQSSVTVKLKDAQGHALTSGGATVSIESTLGTVGPVTDKQDGTYTATLTSPNTLGTATISARVGGVEIAQKGSVQFVAGTPSATTSTLAVSSSKLPADGSSQSSVTVKLKDAQGHALTSGGATVSIQSTLGTVGPVTDKQDGTYTATLTSPNTLGTATISARVGGVEIAQKGSVQFVAGGLSAARSTVTASELVVRADGGSKSFIYVQLKDDYNHFLPGKRVLLQANGGQSVIHDVYGLTNEKGLATFSVSNTATEIVTYTAKEEASGLTLDQTVSISFTYDQPPSIDLQISPSGPTYGDVNVTVTAAVYGKYNQVSSIKWAAGSQPLAYFKTQGMDITDRFTVKENGIYSVYVQDTAGNANVRLVEIKNIVPMSSNANLEDWQLIGEDGTIKFNFKPTTTSYQVEVNHSISALKMILAPSDVYSTVYVNGLQVTSNQMTIAYPLIVGINKYEVKVKAQDGTIKTYLLHVSRLNKNPDSGPTEPASGNSSWTASWPDESVKVWINDNEESGIAKLQVDKNGLKSIDVILSENILKKSLHLKAETAPTHLLVTIKEKADQATLRLPSEVVKLLAEKDATLTLKTQQGHYRVSIAAITGQQSIWTSDREAQITIANSSREIAAEIGEAAHKGGFQLVADPVNFYASIVQGNSEKRVGLTATHDEERAIYLPAGFAGKASTVVAWNQKLGIRPIPTKFTPIHGQQAAVIRDHTNGAYILISKRADLQDTKGHWAAPVIDEMNSRMIVEGLGGSRFAPEARITRAELAALLVRALGLTESENEAGYQDVSSSQWYGGVVASVKMHRMMDGFKDGTFRPNQEVTRQEAIVTIVRALRVANEAVVINPDSYDDLGVYLDHDQVSSWAQEAVRIAIGEGLIKGYRNELHPQQSLTRAEMTVLLYRMLQKAELIDGEN